MRKNEDNSCDPGLAVTRSLGGCTNNARASEGPGQLRPTRHPARPAEKHRRSRRGHARPNGEYGTHEFGTVTNAAEFAWLNAYSPLQHVRPGAAYPAVLLITAENDPRVAPWQSRKFAAALQKANASPRPILLITRRGEGHGVTSSFSQRVGNTGAELSFFAEELGLASAAPSNKTPQ